ncbi:glycosyltransferase family 39 protein [bacterium SCSIO 12741]|nr:glycosyltransferase family 39 protein [bacterium SCSIO 12741]
MAQILNVIKTQWALLFIIALATFLRFFHIDFQSLWLDELHTMVEADPSEPWSVLFHHLNCCDQHPPLHFVAERLSFQIFGHTALVARAVSAIAGILTVYVMFRLGRELKSDRLGLIMALFTAINYYAIFYSQEARGYIFALLFAAWSMLYLIRLIKSPNRKNAIYYALTALGLLYSHYFSLFVAVAQAVIAVIFLLDEPKESRKNLFIHLCVAGGAIAAGYLPWLPFLLSMSKIESFWIAPPSDDFFQTYFLNYFGDSKLLLLPLLVLLISYVVHVVIKNQKSSNEPLKNEPANLLLVVGLVWIVVSFMIPYWRSLMVVPMLFPRYTIIVLPVIIAFLGYGVIALKQRVIQAVLVILVVMFSFSDLLLVKHYYTAPSKTQFREMNAYLAENNEENYPMINERTEFQNQYFMKLYNIQSEVLSGGKVDQINRILESSELKGFWVFRAHGDEEIPADVRTRLLDQYAVAKQQEFFLGSLELFVLKSEFMYLEITHDKGFVEGKGSVLSDNGVRAIWDNSDIESLPFSLEKGKYTIVVYANGTPAQGEFPHLILKVDGKQVGDFFVKEQMADYSFEFEYNPEQAADVTLTLEMDNDFYSEGEGDKNAFVERVIFRR